jgi:uncharacterized protein YdcH (DUF465 family)
MSTITGAVREKLMVGNEHYQRLHDEHAHYEDLLNALTCKVHLSDNEQVEELRLKKLKLRVKDQMELLVRQQARTAN